MNQNQFFELAQHLQRAPMQRPAPASLGASMVPAVHLLAAIGAGAVLAGDTVDADVTDAASATPRLRATPPWRGIATHARVILPSALTAAQIQVITQSVALRFAWSGVTYDVLLADVYGLSPSPTDTGLLAGPVQPADYRPLLLPVTTQGQTSDRVQLVALNAGTLAAATQVLVSLLGAFVDPGTSGQDTLARVAAPAGGCRG